MNEREQFYDDRKDFLTLAKEAIGYSKLDIKIKKLDDRAIIPSYAHDGDVGMDITAISLEYDKELDMYVYHTGLSIETDKHYGVFLFARSSNRKTDAYLCNLVGIADTAIYRGEIIFCFKNRDSLLTIATRVKMDVFMRLMKTQSIVDAIKKAEDAFNEVMDNPMKFAPYQVGDRIGQMVVLPYPDVNIREVNELSQTERGSNGFGSTGN
jgi:dUTP pyrophosphatase